MTKVYVAILEWKYEGGKNIGIYESKKLAEEAIKNYKEKNKNDTDPDWCFYDIEEFELKGEK